MLSPVFVMDPLLQGLEANHLDPSLCNTYLGGFVYADGIGRRLSTFFYVRRLIILIIIKGPSYVPGIFLMYHSDTLPQNVYYMGPSYALYIRWSLIRQFHLMSTHYRPISQGLTRPHPHT